MRRAPVAAPGRYTCQTAFGAERSLTSTTVTLAVAHPQKHPALEQGTRVAPTPCGPMPPPCGTVQMLENTTSWLPSRNMLLGQPSISSLPASARSCGGQLAAAY